MPTTLEKSPDRLLHTRVANRLLDRMREENLQPETRIRTLRQLALDYDVSYQTIQRSVQLLKQRGILEIRRGDGVYLAKGLENIKSVPLQNAAPSGEGGKERKRQRQTDHAVAIVPPVWAAEEYPEHFGQAAVHRLLAGFLAECDQHHWGIEMIYNAPPDEADQPEFVDKIIRRGVDGVLWLRPNVGHRMNMMRLIDRGLFVVSCGRQFPKLPAPNVSEDHVKIARQTFQWLKARGKTRIGLLTALSEGRHADPFAMEINRIIAETAAAEGMPLPESAICQAFDLPSTARQDIMRLFLQRNPGLNGIICAFNPLLSVMEKLALANELPQVNDLICVDLMSDYRPFVPSAKSHLHVAGVQNPLEDIGRLLAAQFVDKWLAATQNNAPLPDPQIIELGSINPFPPSPQ